MKSFDKKYLNRKVKYLAGVDEAGRGPLAGPVVAAAVIFDEKTDIPGVNDSKLLTEVKREELFEKIILEALSYSVAIINHDVIDKVNILNATMLAMEKAILSLNIKSDLILVDGNRIFKSDISVIPIVKGDGKSFSIAAASILAKVTRDRLMKDLANKFPIYSWDQNKGYPTSKHREVIKIYGPSPFHRKSFLKNVLSEQEIIESVNSKRK